MKRLIVVLAIFLGFNSAFCQQQAQDSMNMDEINNLITYYYQNPQPDKLVEAVKILVSRNKFMTDAIHFSAVAHFVATVGHNDKYFLGKLTDAEQDYLGLERTTVENMVLEAQNFSSPSADSPQYLDFLWGEFFATGSDAPVKKIISVLGNESPKLSERVTQGAAEWSLGSNAKQHKRVYEIIQKEAASTTGILKEKLDNILKESQI